MGDQITTTSMLQLVLPSLASILVPFVGLRPGARPVFKTQSVQFFLGILLAISALQSDGLLAALAAAMDRAIGNVDVITISIGLSSSVVHDVPLVAVAQGMRGRLKCAVDVCCKVQGRPRTSSRLRWHRACCLGP